VVLTFNARQHSIAYLRRAHASDERRPAVRIYTPVLFWNQISYDGSHGNTQRKQQIAADFRPRVVEGVVCHTVVNAVWCSSHARLPVQHLTVTDTDGDDNNFASSRTSVINHHIELT